MIIVYSCQYENHMSVQNRIAHTKNPAEMAGRWDGMIWVYYLG